MISSEIVRFDIASEVSMAVKMLAGHPQVEIGELVDGRSLPIVIEAADHHDLRRLHGWVESLPGVQLVDVVFICFDSLHTNC
jgi:nitrate reductase NapAB chaperone NapD